MKDYYKIMELEKTATKEEIKKAFRRLSRLTHPDKSTGDKDKFQELNEAYQTLSDPIKKQAYDTGTKPLAPQQPIVNNIGVQFAWTLRDVKKGKTVQVKFQRMVVCKTCKGVGTTIPSAITTCSHCNGAGRFAKSTQTPFGQMMMEHTCMHCQGEGTFNSAPCSTCHAKKMVPQSATETVTIPPNTINPFPVTRKGHDTVWGTSDLIIYFDFQDPHGIQYQGNAFIHVIKVDFFEALLGKEQIVKFGDTSLKVNLPKESKTNQGFKLNKAYCGIDVIIHITVDSPTIKQTQKYILDLFKDDTEILPAVTKRVNESLK